MNKVYNKILKEVYLVQGFDSWDKDSENVFKKDIQDNLLSSKKKLIKEFDKKYTIRAYYRRSSYNLDFDIIRTFVHLPQNWDFKGYDMEDLKVSDNLQQTKNNVLKYILAEVLLSTAEWRNDYREVQKRLYDSLCWYNIFHHRVQNVLFANWKDPMKHITIKIGEWWDNSDDMLLISIDRKNENINEVYLVQDFDSWDNSADTFKKDIQNNIKSKRLVIEEFDKKYRVFGYNHETEYYNLSTFVYLKPGYNFEKEGTEELINWSGGDITKHNLMKYAIAQAVLNNGLNARKIAEYLNTTNILCEPANPVLSCTIWNSSLEVNQSIIYLGDNTNGVRPALRIIIQEK